jgi:hypothetical protein
MQDQRRDRRKYLLQRHSFSVFVAGTCPEAVALAGSTWAVVADHIDPVVDRSPGLAAGMGWASFDSTRCLRPGCCNNPGGPIDWVARRRCVSHEGTQAVRLRGCPVTVSAKVGL